MGFNSTFKGLKAWRPDEDRYLRQVPKIADIRRPPFACCSLCVCKVPCHSVNRSISRELGVLILTV